MILIIRLTSRDLLCPRYAQLNQMIRCLASTGESREGSFISWHIFRVIKLRIWSNSSKEWPTNYPDINFNWKDEEYGILFEDYITQ